VFTVAGNYYAKSERSIHLLVKQLWKEAAGQLVKAGVLQQGEQTVAIHAAGLAGIRCAKACVACAEAVDGSAAAHALGAGFTYFTDFTLLTTRTVETTYADIALKMRLLLVQAERAALIQVPALQSTGIFKDDHVIADLEAW
jgi:hypothetical protein